MVPSYTGVAFHQLTPLAALTPLPSFVSGCQQTGTAD